MSLTERRLSRTPPCAAGRSPGAQRRGVGCSRGWAARHATPDRGWEAAAPLCGRDGLQSLLQHISRRLRAEPPIYLRAAPAQLLLYGFPIRTYLWQSVRIYTQGYEERLALKSQAVTGT
jgi:hypothetical protein